MFHYFSSFKQTCLAPGYESLIFFKVARLIRRVVKNGEVYSEILDRARNGQ